MAIYEMTKDQIRAVSETSFGKAGVRERTDLQRLLREQVQIVSPDTLGGKGDISKRDGAVKHSQVYFFFVGGT